MDVLPEIAQVAAGRAKIILDGGVQRGGDVLKALALGADAVAIGKLQGWGIAAAGKDGIVRVLEILEDEMISAMGLLGITAVDQLSPKYLCTAEQVTQPHEMSSWVNMPGTRIL
jgi:glycolate oxidase